MLRMPQRTFTEKNIDYQGWCLSNINFSIIYPIFLKSFGEEFEINEVLHRCSKRCVFLVYQRSICSLQSRLYSSSLIPPFPETQMKRSKLLLVKILINLSPLFSSTTLHLPSFNSFSIFLLPYYTVSRDLPISFKILLIS